jgi:F0F1-type ATP synthase assembly protein I
MTDTEIKELKRKIDKIKNEQIDTIKKKQSTAPIIDVAAELVAGVIVGVIIGLLFDELFESKPLFLVICIIFGMMVSFRSIWKKYIKNPEDKHET